jgi:DNA-binding SARP family transcriptional activator
LPDVSNRVIDRLVACAVPCVVFAAPAGFGKTHTAKAYCSRFSRTASITATVGMSALQVVSALHGFLDSGDPASDSLQECARSVWGTSQKTSIVIDSAECLEDAVLFDVLTALELSRPDHGSLVLCIRREPSSFSFSDVFAPHLLVVFRRADLELSFSELRACVPEGTALSVSALYHIYNLTRGWPVPTLSLLRVTVAETFDTAGLHLDHPALSDLFDWLDTNVVQMLSADVRAVLFRCVACCDMMPADFDAEPESEAGRADRRLYRNSQCADVGFSGEILVHPLIALVVRARYAAEVERCARAAATRFLDHGEPVRAVRAMVGIGDLERASAILDDVGFDAARELGGFPYPGLLLEHYSRTKPAYERHPLLWLNLVPCRYYAVGPKTLSREGADILKLHDGSPGRLERWLVATTSMLFDEAGDLQTAEHLARGLRAPAANLDTAGSFDLAEMYLDVSHGRYHSALERWNRLGAAFQSSPVWYGLHLRCAARAEVRLGHLEAGEDALRTLSALLRIGGCPSLATFGDLEAALVAWHRGDAEAFRVHRRDFASIAKSYDVPSMWAVLGALYGDDLGPDKSGDTYDPLAALILAADCRTDLAVPFARRAVASADATGDVAMRIWSRIVAAACDPSVAAEAIIGADVLAQSTDSDALKELVAARLPNSPDTATVFLQRLPIRNSSSDSEHDVSTNELVVCVATGELQRDGRRVKVSEGTLQLLLFLAVYGNVGRNVIVDNLWPELDGDAGSNALKICVHRVRSQLGDASAIVVEKSMYSLGKNVRSSYPHIERLAGIMAYPLSNDVFTEVSDVFDRLTRGLVSARASWDWFRPITRSLLDAVSALGTRLAQYELERDNPQMALQVARRMSGVDPLDEGARTLAIQAYLHMEKSAAALAEFREFSHLLKRELGTEPTGALKRLVGILQ